MTLAELRLATQLASIPAPITEVRPGEDKIPDIVNLLVKNDVPLEPLVRFRQNDYPELFQSPIFNEAYAEQMERCQSWRGEYSILRKNFVELGIHTVLIKSSGFFPYTSGNLDTLVRRKDFDTVHRLLINLGYLELNNCREFNKKLYKKFQQGKETFALHLHKSIGWESTFIGNGEAFVGYSKSKFDPLVTMLSPENYVLTTLAHSFYENEAFRILDIAIIRRGLSEKLDWEYMKGIADQFGWTDGFYAALLIYDGLEKALFENALLPGEVVSQATSYLGKGYSWFSRYLRNKFKKKIELPFRLNSNVRRLFFYKKLITQPRNMPLSTRLWWTSSVIKEYILFSLGMKQTKPFLISLSGPDGAGKTTFAQSLASLFQQCGVNSKIVWLRIASSPLWYLRLKNRFSSNQSSPGDDGSGGNDKVGVVTRIARTIDLFMFLLTAALWLSLKLSRRNVVLICDRYYYDAIVDMKLRGTRYRHLISRIMNILCRRPDINLLMYVAGEELEKSVEYQHQKKYFAELEDRFNFWVTHRSAGSDDESQQWATEIVRRYLEQCFHRKYLAE